MKHLELLVVCLLSAGFGHSQVAVTTNRYDNARSGQNTQESVLNPTNVSVNTFGRMWWYQVDGQVYAQPLYVPNVSIPGKGPRNVLYVVTEHDSVYAFDAERNGEVTGPFWTRSFIDPQNGITPLSTADVGCGDAIAPEIGITSTPVIDLDSSTVYVVAVTKENGRFVQRLHALDMTNGQERPASPVEIQATYPGVGYDSVNGQIAFNPLTHLQRTGLLLNQGNVYITWASYCDIDPYHGWIMVYDKTSLQQTAVWMNTPNGGRGGNWMTGTGLAADDDGNVYAVVGNGTFDENLNPPLDFGDSILKISLQNKTLQVLDYFTPYNEAYLASQDWDLGSSGGVLLPMQSGPHPFEIITSGKQGRVYVVDRNSMGHFDPNSDHVVQSFDLTHNGKSSALFSTVVSWNGNVFFGNASDLIRAYSVSNGLLSATPSSTSPQKFGWPGPSLVASSNQDAGGILWALETAPSNPAVLHAFDAGNLSSELYNSSQNAPRDKMEAPAKFAVPTVANGRVYVGATGTVGVYGLLSSTTPTPAISPWGGTYATAQTVSISDDRQDSVIYYTTDGSTPNEQSTPYTGPLTISASTVLQAIAIAPNASPSLVRIAGFTIVPDAEGFADYAQGFQMDGLNLVGSAALVGSRLRLTDGGQSESGNAWYSIPVNVQAFVQDFLVQLSNPAGDGMTFIIQNAGPSVQGYGGGYLAYYPITPSAAIKFDLYNNAGEGSDSTGLYTGGNLPFLPAVDLSTTPIDLHSQHIMAVHMTYDGAILAMQITDTATNQSYSTQWSIDIPAAVGSTTAYVGFGAGTSSLTAVQEVLSWSFVSAPLSPAPKPAISPWGGTYAAAQTVTITDDRQDATIYYTTDGSTPTQQSPVYTGPFMVQTSEVVQAVAIAPNATLSGVQVAGFTIVVGAGTSLNYGSGFQPSGLNLLGSTTLAGSRLRLTDGGLGEVAATWYTTPVNVQSFAQDFLIQLTNPIADGMTFILQSAGPSVSGWGGGYLGYSPIAPSAAVKFDLYNNAGEGSNSIGLYVGGNLPFVPAVDLTGTPIDLHSQHIMAVHMTYDGATLVMRITDTETNQAYSTQWTVNLPMAVGGNTAYVGFGAGTGGLSATQDVLAWTFVSTPLGATPTPDISPWGGTYAAAQTVTLSDDRQDAVICYTTDGSNPTEQSPVYNGPFTVSASTVVKAMAMAPNATPSNVRVASFTIVSGGLGSLNYGLGFQQDGLNLVGSPTLAGSRLRLTDGGLGETANVWYATPLNVQAFTQDFLFQIANAQADGLTFIAQNAGPSVSGWGGGYLGYTPLTSSVAIKFDVFDNLGEGPNSTGLYAGGAQPMLPATDLRGTAIDLRSEHVMAVHMTYDGTVLAMQITDTETNQSYATQWTVDIPSAVGGNTAYVGFGAGTGGLGAVQDILSWTLVSQGQGPSSSIRAIKRAK